MGFPADLVRKGRKARDVRGPRFLHVLSPCPPGWRFDADRTVEVARLAVDTKLFPLYEVEAGRVRVTRKPYQVRPVEEYLRLQDRFGHLTAAMRARLQEEVDRSWQRLLRTEELMADGALW